MIATITTNQETFLAMMALILFAFLTRASVGIHSQNWIKTFSGTMTLFLLPIITFAITSVISGNIALSLGMIGALSIVRFRNPVRSSFELVIFFLMLSLGICAAADMKWLIVLGISSNLIIIGAYFYKNMAKKLFGVEVFANSFSEGNSMNTLEIILSKNNNELFKHPLLISFYMSNNEYIYRLASNDVSSLKELSAKFQDNEGTVNMRYSSS